MKLASLKSARDGQLVVVDKTLTRMITVPGIASTLQSALDQWSDVAPMLENVYRSLCDDRLQSADFDPSACASPFPRAYHWVDCSGYVNHVELVRKARNAPMPESLWTDPLVYQGGSDCFLGPHDPITAAEEDVGIDFEAEVAYVVDDVPMGVSEEEALGHIKLVMLVNDVSLRNLIPAELAKGFGFYQSKPSSAFSPVAVTPDELGAAWHDGKLHLPLRVTLNGQLVGSPNTGEDMTFTPAQLIAYVAMTRPLCTGTIVGTGTVSNVDRSTGYCCLAEIRTLETIDTGKPITPFLAFGDQVRIEMLDDGDESIFGAIEQTVEQYQSNDSEDMRRARFKSDPSTP